jgi:NADH dehydrogenase FAD-containing subunit
VLNPIPPQKAPQLLADAGLLNSPDGRFAAVNVLSYESTKVAGIHIIGDASHTTQPKAGHVANQQAKVCADAIVRLLGGKALDPTPVTNSACYSPITASTATFLSAVYQYDAATASMKLSKLGASSSANNEHYRDMQTWFATLMKDSFA